MPSRHTSTGRVVALGGADPAAAWLSLLQASATYAWDGVQGLTLASWTDVVQGVAATAVGSGTTLGTLNERTAAVFSGAGYFDVTIATIPQPYTIVSVSQRTSTNLTIPRCIHSGTSVMGRLRHAASTGVLQTYASTTLNGTTIGLIPAVIVAIFNGANSQILVNGAMNTSGNTGTSAVGPAFSIGWDVWNAGQWFIGPIAHVSIYHGATLANAATVAAAAMQYYGVTP